LLEDRFLDVHYERPTPYIYEFQGNFTPYNCNTISVGYHNFILRGSVLKNTAHIFGLVLYTGNMTKIMINSVKSRSKHSQVEHRMNLYIVTMFMLQIVVCFLTALYSAI